MHIFPPFQRQAALCLALAWALLAVLSPWPADCNAKPAREAAKPIYKGQRQPVDHRKDKLPAAPLGMQQAVERALGHSPSLGSQEAQSRASEEARKSTIGAFGPKLGMTYSAIKQERKTEPASTRAAEYGTYSWGVEVSQPVFQGFRLLANYQKAALQADSDLAALRNAELSTTQQVQAEFLACLAAEELVKSETESLGRLRDQLRITQAFHEVGLRPKLDVLQAEVDVSQAENVVIQAENTRDTAYAKLNTLLGFPAEARLTYVGQLKYVPFGKSLESCLKTAYAKRPDLYVANKAVEIAKKDQTLAQSGYYPRIEAYYNINQRGNTPDLQIKGNNGSRSSTWEVGVTASWDVFQWGVTWFDDKRAGWLVTKMRQEEENLKLNVGYEIKSRFLALREAEKRIGVAEKGVAQAREAYQAALARYQEQVGTNFDVLDASSNLNRAQASLTSSRADYLTALSQLYYAMGEFHPDLLKP
ncbi:MAG: TolC family protein [Desulfovibrio sp.]|nr:TolC family protein [Desulfovibrio sp.]